jgi:inosine-uridine nucleoside N-ribohydrolase
MTKKVILDVDTGCDDAVAFLLSGHHPDLEFVAPLPVHGNAHLSQTLDNTLRLLSAGKLEHVPVYVGAEHPLVGPIIAGDGDQVIKMPFPESTIRVQEKHAVNYLIDYYMSDSSMDTIYMPLAPLTNLALALRIEPRLKKRIPQIITMGGAYATSFAEFNIKADPEAAHIVYTSGIPITMVGLEVTDMAKIRQEDSDNIRKLQTPWAVAAADIMDVVVDIHVNKCGMDGAIIFDACAVAAAIEPQILQTRKMHVDIELTGAHTRGCTAADERTHGQRSPANVDVGVSINRSRFIEILHEGLS